VNLARRGARQLETKVEVVDDPTLIQTWRNQAAGIWRRSLIWTAIATLLLLLIP